jgi:hypothetical protein
VPHRTTKDFIIRQHGANWQWFCYFNSRPCTFAHLKARGARGGPASASIPTPLGEGDLSEKLKKGLALNGKAARFAWMVTTCSIATITSGQSNSTADGRRPAGGRGNER